MPRATVNISDTHRIDLETCPGGYVVLRRMNWGEYLARREMAMKMQMKFKSQGRRGRPQADEDNEALLDLANREVTEMEFKLCIVEHNLEDERGNLLDFSNPGYQLMLDPRIGDEISYHIGQMNNWEPDLQMRDEKQQIEDGPLPPVSGPVSSSTVLPMRQQAT